jgi:hypothetical protein
LQAILPVDLARKVIGMTDADLSRHASIEAYVEDQAITTDHYVIVDDDAAAFPEAPPQLVLVPSRTGISSAAAQAALSTALSHL